MNTISNIKEDIIKSVCLSVKDSAWDSVRDSVHFYVWNPVGGSVEYSVLDSMHNINGNIQNKLNEYKF